MLHHAVVPAAGGCGGMFVCHATHAANRMPPHLQAVAREYAWWVNDSEPFDVGATTATAFSLPFGQKSDYAATIQVKGWGGWVQSYFSLLPCCAGFALLS